jgi:hypothetical protein
MNKTQQSQDMNPLLEKTSEIPINTNINRNFTQILKSCDKTTLTKRDEKHGIITLPSCTTLTLGCVDSNSEKNESR